MTNEQFMQSLPKDLQSMSLRLMAIAGNWANQEERNRMLALVAVINKTANQAHYTLAKIVDIYDAE